METVLFFVFGATALAGALGVVLARNPVHSALFLVQTLVSIAVYFVIQEAELLAAVQVIVYAGAIVVLFLFVIMLVHQRTAAGTAAFQHQWDIALLLLPVFMIPFLYILGTEKFADVARNPDAFRAVSGRVVGNTEAVSWLMFRDYLLPFEVASVFLLVAMIGAVVLGKRSFEKVD